MAPKQTQPVLMRVAGVSTALPPESNICDWMLQKPMQLTRGLSRGFRRVSSEAVKCSLLPVFRVLSMFL